MNQYAAKEKYDELRKQGIEAIITSHRGEFDVEPVTKPDVEQESASKAEKPKGERKDDK